MRKAWLVINEYLQSNKFNEIYEWLIFSSIRHDVDMQIKTNAELMPELVNNKEFLIENPPSEVFVLFWDKDIQLARYLEYQGYSVFNSSHAIEFCDNKALMHLELMKAGIRMPKTVIAPMTYDNIGYTNYNFINHAIEKLGLPMIIKEAFGSFGQQVYMAKNKHDAFYIIKKIGTKPFILQEFIATSYGRDLRLQVVGEQVVATMYRYSDSEEFRANITNGGKMKPYTPTEEQCDLAIKACRALGTDFGGVDILFGDHEEPIVCEVNSNAHFKNIFDCTGINVADHIIEYVLNGEFL